MKILYAEDVADLVHQLNDLGKSFLFDYPMFDTIEVGGEEFSFYTPWVGDFEILTKVDDDGLMEEDYFQTVTANSTNKALVICRHNITGNYYSFIQDYNGKVFDAFFYDGLIESLKKSLLLSVFYDRVTSIRKIHRRTLEIAGHMGDEDASVLAQYAYSR